MLIEKPFKELYETLPQDLKDALFSEDVSENIITICEKTDTLNKVEKVSDAVGMVILGVLPPEKLEEQLKGPVGIEAETAREINSRINQLVFSPLKESLARLYSKKFSRNYGATPTAEETDNENSSRSKPEPEENGTELPRSENRDEKKGPDTYRESIE